MSTNLIAHTDRLNCVSYAIQDHVCSINRQHLRTLSKLYVFWYIQCVFYIVYAASSVSNWDFSHFHNVFCCCLLLMFSWVLFVKICWFLCYDCMACALSYALNESPILPIFWLFNRESIAYFIDCALNTFWLCVCVCSVSLQLWWERLFKYIQ